MTATRTTITLDLDLLAEAKVEAARSGRTVSEWIAESMRDRLARRTSPSGRERVQLPTWPGGPRPGIDLDNNAAIRDLLDEDEGYWR
jgi:hypothetical protein